MYIHYYGSTDGMGESGAPDDVASWETFVYERLTERFPTHAIDASVEPMCLRGKVRSNDPNIDDEEICSWIENELWVEWCESSTTA